MEMFPVLGFLITDFIPLVGARRLPESGAMLLKTESGQRIDRS